MNYFLNTHKANQGGNMWTMLVLLGIVILIAMCWLATAPERLLPAESPAKYFCEKCKGIGWEDDYWYNHNSHETCWYCKGKGEFSEPSPDSVKEEAKEQIGYQRIGSLKELPPEVRMAVMEKARKAVEKRTLITVAWRERLTQQRAAATEEEQKKIDRIKRSVQL